MNKVTQADFLDSAREILCGLFPDAQQLFDPDSARVYAIPDSTIVLIETILGRQGWEVVTRNPYTFRKAREPFIDLVVEPDSQARFKVWVTSRITVTQEIVVTDDDVINVVAQVARTGNIEGVSNEVLLVALARDAVAVLSPGLQTKTRMYTTRPAGRIMLGRRVEADMKAMLAIMKRGS